MSSQILTTDLLGHPARRAWMRLSSKHGEPVAIERLQKKKKGKVYRLHGAGPDGADIVAKRSSPERIDHERTIYEYILPSLPVPTPRYHGCVEEPDGAYWWLFVEDADGKMYSPTCHEHRHLAARWLGRLHTSTVDSVAASRLAGRGPDYYHQHLRSAHDLALRSLNHPALTADDVKVLAAIATHCEVVESHWSEIARSCETLPRTLIHGDFAPKNMRIRSTPHGLALLAFDWGSAGWGMVAPDLAQVEPSSGRWDYWASPDLATYSSIVQDRWPHVSFQDIRRLAVIGQIFRCLVCVSLSAPSFATQWIEEAARNMAIYEGEIADAVRAAEWTKGEQ
jgi:Phosphotransferase enzyme family